MLGEKLRYQHRVCTATVTCRITDLAITCGVRLKGFFEKIQSRRQTAKGTLAVSPRQARMVAPSSTDAPSGSGPCYAASTESEEIAGTRAKARRVWAGGVIVDNVNRTVFAGSEVSRFPGPEPDLRPRVPDLVRIERDPLAGFRN